MAIVVAEKATETVTDQGKEVSWPLMVAVLGLTCLPIGLIWDISHHTTIGRDSFWTPAHIIIQLGGILPAAVFCFLAVRMTFLEPGNNAGAISIAGIRAPVGAWVTMWGCLAMLTSAPFDDWWHNAYGLDVKIISPPHAVLGIGMLAVSMGVLLYVYSSQNRAGNTRKAGLICAIATGVMLALVADFLTEFTWPNLQRTSTFYKRVSFLIPLILVMAARASSVRMPATIAAAGYMAVYIFMILALPLFPAEPKLAPVYHKVTHMVPPAFPMLLIVPAAAIDLLEWIGRKKLPARWWRDWILSFFFAAAFLGLMVLVHWHFSAFLLSDAADNRFFARDGHWPYFAQPGDWMNTFWNRDKDPITAGNLGKAFLRAFAASRLALWLGNYLLKLKR